MSEGDERWVVDLYRAGAQEQPPASLDAAILAEARNMKRRRRPAALNWGVPFAVAALVVLTASLVIVLRDELAHRDESGAQSGNGPAVTRRIEGTESNAAASKPNEADTRAKSEWRPAKPALSEPARTPLPQPASPTPAAPAKPTDGFVVSPEKKTEEPVLGTLSSPSTPASPPAPAPVLRSDGAAAGARALSESTVPIPPGESSQSELAGRTIQDRQQAKPSQGGKPSALQLPGATRESADGLRAGSEQEMSPEKWLDQIIALRKQGREAEAMQSLAQFRKRFPTYPLPATLR